MRSVAGLPVRGPVRVCRHELAEWDHEGQTWRATQYLTIVTFRPDGLVSEDEYHNPDGSIARSAHAYDDEGRLTQVESWTDDGSKSSVVHAYDQAGRRIGSVHVAPDGTRQDRETCSYDSTGRKTTTLFLPEPGIPGPGTPIVVGYGIGDDADEDTDEMILRDAKHRLTRRIVRSRDQNGRVLRVAVYFGGETPLADFSGDLDKVPPEERARMATLLARVFADRTFVSLDYAYDEKGRLIERTTRMGALSEERTTFTYNDRDDPIDEISEHHSREANIDDDGVLQTMEAAPRTEHTRFDYQYDDHGNWTERVVGSLADSRTEFQRSNVIRRTMTYYGAETTTLP